MEPPVDPRDATEAVGAPSPSTVTTSSTAAATSTTSTTSTTGLTRVAIDPSQLVDDDAGDWCRHEVRRIMAWHLVVTGVVSFVVLTPLISWYLGDVAQAAILAVVGALVVTAARFGFSLVAAPLGYRYVQRFTSSPPEFLLAHHSTLDGPVTPWTPAPARSAATPADEEPVDLWDLDPEAPADPTQLITAEVPAAGGTVLDPDGEPVPERHASSAEVLRNLGFAPAATLRIDGPAGRYTDLYTDGDRIVAAVDRTSGSTVLLTELVGFRVLVTSALLVPPTDELVVNVVEPGDTYGLVLSHQRLVYEAFRSRTRVSEPVGLFKLAQQRELEAYRELGPLWGAVLDLRCRPRGMRLLAAPSAGEVLLFSGNRLFRQTAREVSS